MKTFSMTHVGQRRETNQDYMFTSETAVGNLPNLFLVADGMGGHAAGDYASRFAAETAAAYIRRSSGKEPEALLMGAVEEANRLLLAEANADANKLGMGTTFVAATVIGETLYTVNVGDSRLYIIGSDGMRQITRDHSLVQEMVRMGEMKQEEAKHHPDKHIITRAVGVQDTVEADMFETTLKQDDVILLCSDGLTNMIADEEIRRIVLLRRDLAEAAETLIDTANKNGGQDNITVVLVEPFPIGG